MQHHVLASSQPFPPAIKPRFEGFVDLDDPEMAATSILQCKTALRCNTTTAGGDLLIAQHRDTLLYARMGAALGGEAF